MKKYLIAAALIVSFAAPALADEIFVMLRYVEQKMRNDESDAQRHEKLQNAGQAPDAGRSRQPL